MLRKRKPLLSKKAPKNGLGPDLNSNQLTEVSYLAIEPGVADF